MKALLLVALLAISALGQSPGRCDMSVDKLKPVQGIKLRMSEAEVLKLPVVEQRSLSPLGRYFESSERLVTAEGRNPPAFVVRTFDGMVWSFSVNFGDGVVSAEPDDFVKMLAGSLDLPLQSWSGFPGEIRGAICPEFNVTFSSRYKYVTLHDTVAGKKLQKADAELKKLRVPNN